LNMNKHSAFERMQKLRKMINYHRMLYHTFDAPEISDAAFDTLKNELEELEYKFPEFVTSDSPTQIVGGKPLEEFVKVKHRVPMLSFNDAFSEQEMREWVERVEKYLGIDIKPFYCELKIDGLAIELVYERGMFVQGSTRGDGTIGEDITQNLKTIFDIPQKLEQLGPYAIPEHLTVRGEVYITKKELSRINRDQRSRGQKQYANARNLAAGSIRQLDPAIAASRNLKSFQYEIVQGIPASVRTHEQKHKALASWGFHINEHNRVKQTLADIFAFRGYWEKHRDKLAYDIDGIVVLANDNAIFERGGVAGKAPRAGIAYKFSPKEATTIVRDIVVQVGRTGNLTPVAVLHPVEVGGITITHATLHNFDQIERLGLKIGDTVIVSRAGDVIPQVIQVLPELRTGKEKSFRIPTLCPIDGAAIVHNGVMYKCSNPLCGARQRRALEHFVSRNAFAIDGLGPKILERFIENGMILNAADIFSLSCDDIAELERFGKKSAENLVSEIERKKIIALDKFLYALGILHVGEETAQLLAQQLVHDTNMRIGTNDTNKYKLTIKNIAAIACAWRLEDLQQVPDIGPKVSQSIYNWFHDKRNIALLEKLQRAGVKITNDKLQMANQKLSGKVFVLTGTLTSMTREQAKQKIRELGGDISESVSRNTDFVVAGEHPGSKYDNAKKLGVAILDEKRFIAFIGK